MSITYGVKDPLKGITSDGLIFYIHPAITESYPGSGLAVYDLVDGQACTMNGSDIHVDKKKEAFVFNGSDDWIDTNRVYIDDGTYSISSTNDDYTLEAWVYIETSQGDTTSADSIVGNTSNYGVGMQIGSGPFINYGARSTSNFDSTRPLTQGYNTWIHVVFAKQHSEFTKTFINGTLDTTSSVSSYDIASSGWGNMTIGYSGPRVTGYFDGMMGPVRIYNRGLTDEEVLRNFNASNARYGL